MARADETERTLDAIRAYFRGRYEEPMTLAQRLGHPGATIEVERESKIPVDEVVSWTWGIAEQKRNYSRVEAYAIGGSAHTAMGTFLGTWRIVVPLRGSEPAYGRVIETIVWPEPGEEEEESAYIAHLAAVHRFFDAPELSITDAENVPWEATLALMDGPNDNMPWTSSPIYDMDEVYHQYGVAYRKKKRLGEFSLSYPYRQRQTDPEPLPDYEHLIEAALYWPE